jgi:hypothetical protein
MLEVALPILNRDEDGFMVVLEEEGTDNFGNNNNGRGLVEATRRADDAIGVLGTSSTMKSLIRCWLHLPIATQADLKFMTLTAQTNPSAR